MGQIVQFIRPYDIFDPETLIILGDASTRQSPRFMIAGN